MEPFEPVSITGLSKRFKGKPAVDGLNLSVSAGVLFGLLGPDGSGKSTTLRMLSGVLEPDDGQGSILGRDFPGRIEDAKHELGYMPQRFGLYGDLSVWENLLFYSRIHRVPPKGKRERMEYLLSFSNLLPFKDRLARNLSGGMKQKLGLACALIHSPKLLLLDEPTSGVDPVSRREFWDILVGLLAEGVAMVIATTYLDEAERCHRIGLLHQGRLISEGSSSSLKSALSEAMWELTCEPRPLARKLLRAMHGVKQAVRFGESIHVALDANETEAGTVWETLRNNGVSIIEVHRIPPSLEDVYILTVGRHEQNTDDSNNPQ